MDRKKFLRQSLAGTGFIISAPILSSAAIRSFENDPLPPEKVKEFVIAGHGNFDQVKKMIAETPTLLYATWDWGNGDFETALEGAGHVGNKEIANYLISLGARANLFVLTMLGKTSIVKPFLDTFPQYQTARGPHGFTFFHHAQKGGDDARELLEYFQAKGLTEDKVAL
ncbi:MAG: ankyrin repeat domain-containing protein [Bacteroidetes bacterium]|nr:MAG: ankyrin repeat domain-containing protein [Bacteroidota bacterium]